MIRKLASGQYRLYSRKKDPKTGRRRNLGTFRDRRRGRTARARGAVLQAPVTQDKINCRRIGEVTWGLWMEKGKWG